MQFFEEKFSYPNRNANPQSKSSQQELSGADNRGEIKFAVPFESGLDETGELPIAKAVRFIREELDKVESRNQLINYLKAFEEIDGSAIDGKIPY